MSKSKNDFSGVAHTSSGWWLAKICGQVIGTYRSRASAIRSIRTMIGRAIEVRDEHRTHDDLPGGNP
jgi:hypothetical protein